eukprot:m.19180 g.19180  ORF g.19180 m.19180 type:complete len:63 (-) comp7990_c0_seq1:415-603(-)
MNFCTAWIRCMTHNKLTTTTTLFHGSLVSENNPLANFSRLSMQVRCEKDIVRQCEERSESHK